jgi:hypothetical protein
MIHVATITDMAGPQLSEDTILLWAQAHHARVGTWPSQGSGPVYGVTREIWANLDQALRYGRRGLPGGDSLSRLLARRLGKPPKVRRRPLTLAAILAWADAYHQQMGRWPSGSSPPNGLPRGEQWNRIDTALRQGTRGLPGGSSLARLLVEHRGKPRRLPRERCEDVSCPSATSSRLEPRH